MLGRLFNHPRAILWLWGLEQSWVICSVRHVYCRHNAMNNAANSPRLGASWMVNGRQYSACSKSHLWTIIFGTYYFSRQILNRLKISTNPSDYWPFSHGKLQYEPIFWRDESAASMAPLYPLCQRYVGRSTHELNYAKVNDTIPAQWQLKQ